ncbi:MULTISPECIES: AI-2E family transporter [Pseudovibrio]|uniref:AI-2E family transporter n=1 Tax=Stappiaceae TaxID=2821832 RepID=UPI002365755D|nr:MULTISPECIES: AI-2E family transporter [Pseudovibrio]MDD7910260.1 AI-2E family transporter [Pseudovibrio exalbescens]MDX5593976.1 AI-2E family transporter [Pseudovibrio sp. SPO723]
MNSTLLKLTLALILVMLIGWLLVIGRSILIPLIIASVLWYLISSLAEAVRSVPYLGRLVPRPLGIVVSLCLMLVAGKFVFDIVSTSLQQMAADAPLYQRRLDEVFLTISTQLKLDDPIGLSDVLPNFSIGQTISAAAGVLTTIAGSSTLIFVYVLFMIFEESTFDRKIEAFFDRPERARLALGIRREIGQRMRHYVGIKTAISLATGFLTYFLLKAVGLPYAELFGFITFLLNYIPTIGSMIAVVFASMFALVFFDNLSNFLIVAIGLGLIQFVLGSILDPRLMGTSLNISPLVIIISLSFWGSIWGVIGMVLCVPLMVFIIMVCAQFPASRPIAILFSGNGEVGEPILLEDKTKPLN